ncbi:MULTISPECIES: hypothetical protein [Halomonas]|uniref:hypothetical protein n=1 Tax=Halomonas TaxID=2745 RepID=UPI001C96D07D|nr:MULTISPECIES: hypothetical protein [Halomonas]MBY6208782.1 hypothetical protein [Halomonas sp. DP3Y7-2]MBY6227252.1 hypothetical protein [Halomonas sp. DP3Y7-1]MCA0914998.1 hypothetical protein [Halomonas denitrificans]
MKMKTFARGFAGVVTVLPRERKPVKYIKQMPLAARQRSDREAIWGDFCALGDDLRKARELYDRTENAT